MDESSPTIADNTISGNSANDGGGLCLFLDSSPTIANNTITGNSALYVGAELCLRVNASPTIANNRITGNSAGYGVGLYLDSSSPTIANNRITGNLAGDGGGLYLFESSPTIANTIVAFNSFGVYRESGTSALRHNCVYGNTVYDYSGLPNLTGTDGNISADPLFVQDPDPGPDGLWGTGDDDLGDVHLLSDSPCVDAGDNDSIPPDTPDLDDDGDTVEPVPIDFDCHARVLCGEVDMGAYESGIGDYQCDDDVDLYDFTAWEACMTGPGKGPYDMGCQAFDFEFDGDVDLTDFAGIQARFSNP